MTAPAPLDQTPEERALAQRLARLAPHGEPSPQLDARVMAAARAGLAAHPRPIPRSRRWRIVLGMVASLVLAVGVAWRLRPLPPGATPDLAAPAHPVPQTIPAPPPPEPEAAASAAQTAPETIRDAGIAGESPARSESIPRRAAKIATPAPQSVVQPQASVASPLILQAPAPPPAPAPPQEAGTPERDQGTPAAVTGENDAADLDRATASQAQAEASDEPLDTMPPATADAPGVRDAWLARIRALLDSGDVAGGRRSLRAFAERYPDYPLPEDLRALLR